MNDARAHAPRPDRDESIDRDDAGDEEESAMERADRANGEPDAQEPGA